MSAAEHPSLTVFLPRPGGGFEAVVVRGKSLELLVELERRRHANRPPRRAPRRAKRKGR